MNEKEYNTPLISICIPTYNRGNILFRCLKSICAQNIFKNTSQIEIIISDNVSEDSTPYIVNYFKKKFPDKIFYYRNDTNISDRNFPKALSYGHGIFLKLLNDTFIIKKGFFECLIDVVNKNLETKPVVFISPCKKNFSVSVYNNMNAFLSEVSYTTTWIGGFGIWKEDYKIYEDNFCDYSDKGLAQTDILLKMLSKKQKSICVFNNLFAMQKVWRKGHYNIAEVFGANYIYLLKKHLNQGVLSVDVFEKEKRKLLTKHILPYYFSFDYEFIHSGLIKFLYDYKYNLYAYFYVLYWYIKFAFEYLKKYVKNIYKKNNLFKIQWREGNKHNDTIVIDNFNSDKVSVGNNTVGLLNIQTSNPNENIVIGNYVCISNNVKFVPGEKTKEEECPSVRGNNLKDNNQIFGKLPTIIEDDVYIGADSLVCFGVTIGQGAIVKEGSIVDKNVEPYSVVGGKPAKFIKYRFNKDICENLIKLDLECIPDKNYLKNKDSLYSSDISIDYLTSLI